MRWTDEAVELLRRLALAGVSASGIAAALGAESRNAVIGKANRLGVRLAGGRGAGAPAGANAARPAPARRPATAAAATLAPRPRRTGWIFAEAEVGEMRRVRFAEVLGASCRWPIGDPAAGDFAFCGLTPADGRPYCAGHCRIAYRPPGDGPRARGVGRGRPEICDPA